MLCMLGIIMHDFLYSAHFLKKKSCRNFSSECADQAQYFVGPISLGLNCF